MKALRAYTLLVLAALLIGGWLLSDSWAGFSGPLSISFLTLTGNSAQYNQTATTDDGTGAITFNGTGAPNIVNNTTGNLLVVHGGTAGFRVRNNAGTTTNFDLTDAGVGRVVGQFGAGAALPTGTAGDLSAAESATVGRLLLGSNGSQALNFGLTTVGNFTLLGGSLDDLPGATGNGFELGIAAAASAPTLKAIGSDTNVTMQLQGKGTGAVNVVGGSPLGSTGGTAPTVATCGTGTIAASSTNNAGSVTATGAVACTVTFATGTPFANAPVCVATDATTAAALKLVNTAATSITVSGLTSGDVFNYVCVGK